MKKTIKNKSLNIWDTSCKMLIIILLLMIQRNSGLLDNGWLKKEEDLILQEPQRPLPYKLSQENIDFMVINIFVHMQILILH